MDASAITTVAAALGITAVVWGLQRSFRREMRTNDADLKADIADIRTEIRANRTEFKADMANLETKLRADRTELKGEIRANRTEFKADMTDLETKLKGEIKALDDRIVSLIEDIGKMDSRVQRMEGYLIGRRGEAFRRADDEPTSER